MQQHGEKAALATAADGADDRAAALPVDQLHRQDAQHERSQLLGHRVAREQQRDQVLHEVGFRRIELGERLGRGVAQEQRVQRQQAHRGGVPAALQRGEAAGRADARQQLEPVSRMHSFTGAGRPSTASGLP